MKRFMQGYVRITEKVNYRIGRFAMYGIFVMLIILGWSTVTKMFLTPSIWTLEMAQFTLVAYYLLGAPYTFQLGTNVRMDLLYARMTAKTQALWDAFTIFALIFYLGVMLYGAWGSTIYSIETGERAPTGWRPYLWPIKVIICVSFVLMILQSTVHLIRDIAVLRDKEF